MITAEKHMAPHGFTSEAICKACGGNCCKCIPGIYSPEDIEKIPFAQLIDMMLNGKIAVDWWEGDIRDIDEESDDYLAQIYYFRPPTLKHRFLYDPSWGAPCLYLLPDGCALPYEQRPEQCRMLEPKLKDPNVNHIFSTNIKCEQHLDKVGVITAWLPYQEMFYGIPTDYR